MLEGATHCLANIYWVPLSVEQDIAFYSYMLAQCESNNASSASHHEIDGDVSYQECTFSIFDFDIGAVVDKDI
ncbi:MAG: hypothetical protein ACETWD_05020 [Desulfatiglandales bacterium]